ncbi:MAG: hypothetical protein NZ891_08480, partial [bacterium]|nr:hypothetical protein [bacterium]MDW8164757.1 glycoside hydrolase family 38 C-terminal domain-containing protein [Candidatus Omnitrophota bacterium]
ADGNASCAFEVSKYLESVRKILENELIYAYLEILSLHKYPSKKIYEIWENLFFFAEHTFGASESIKNPFSVNSILQWQIKSNFIYNAYIENERLYKKGTEIFKKINLEFEEYNIRNFSKINNDFKIENDFYRIEINEENGAISSIIDKELKEEMVDKDSPYLFNRYIFEEIVSKEGRNSIWDEYSKEPLWSESRKRRDAKFKRYFSKLKFAEKCKNKEAEKIILKLKGKGCKNILSEIELCNKEKIIKIKNTLFKEENINPEGVYFAFPFNLICPKIKISGPGKSIFIPEKEQLLNTAKDYYSTEDWIILSDISKSILFISPDSPLIQLSDINTGKWLKKLDIKKGWVFSYVINNYWYTNFKC